MKFDNDTISLIQLFERTSTAKVKDCFTDSLNQLTFIIEQGDIAKAVGKNAATVLKIQDMLKRKFRVIEYDTDIRKFIANTVRPNKLERIDESDGVYTIYAPDYASRGYLIGKNASFLRNTEAVVKRYFDIKEIKVGETWEKKQTESTQQQS
jgi:NusA-like KH domain protein